MASSKAKFSCFSHFNEKCELNYRMPLVLKIRSKIHPPVKTPHIEAVNGIINKSLAKATKLGKFAEKQ